MEVEENHSCIAHEGQTPPSSPSSPSVPNNSRLLLAPPRRASWLLLIGLQTPAAPRLLSSRLQPPSSSELPRDRPPDSDFPDNEPNSTSSISAKLLQALPGSSTRSPSPSCHLFSLPPSPISYPTQNAWREARIVHAWEQLPLSSHLPHALSSTFSLSLSLCPVSSQAPPSAAPRLRLRLLPGSRLPWLIAPSELPYPSRPLATFSPVSPT